MPITPDELKQVMRRWTTGVTVVTSRRPGGIHGMTANSFCAVSLDPPLVLVCIDRRTRTHEYLLEEGAFAVHILAEGQQELSRRCAGAYGETGNELHDVTCRAGKTGAPILDGCLAYVDCRTVHTYDGGDHTIFVGEVVESGPGSDERPLVYFSGGYRRIGEA